MTALAGLRARGIEVYLAPGGPRCRVPRGALTAEELADLRAHRAELLAELRREQAAALLEELRARGVTLSPETWPNGEPALRVRWGQARTPELDAAVADLAAEVRALLAAAAEPMLPGGPADG